MIIKTFSMIGKIFYTIIIIIFILVNILDMIIPVLFTIRKT
jgi:hypothetical protein